MAEARRLTKSSSHHGLGFRLPVQAPVAECFQDRAQRVAFLCETVCQALGPICGRDLFDHAMPPQAVQTLAQDVGGNALGRLLLKLDIHFILDSGGFHAILFPWVIPAK